MVKENSENSPTILGTVIYHLIFLQNWPVLCKVSGNLPERVFLLELAFAMINILNYNHTIKQFNNNCKLKFGCSQCYSGVK